MVWVPPAAGRFTSGYGPRDTGIPGASTYHRGVDIAPPRPGQTGWPCVAVTDGVVLARGYSTVRGWWTVLRLADGCAVRYQHLAAQPPTMPGGRLPAGARVGTIGKTGTSAGEHLHFEWFPAGADWTSSTHAVDPVPAMAARGVDLRADVTLTGNPLWTTGGLIDVTALPDLTPLTPEDDMQLTDPIPGTDLTVGQALARTTYLDARVSEALAVARRVEARTGPYLDARVSETLAVARQTLAGQVTAAAGDLDDTALAAIATAVSDEQDRRARERLA